MDGNTVVAAIMGGSVLVSIGISWGISSANARSTKELLAKTVTTDSYDEKQKAQDHEIAEIKTEVLSRLQRLEESVSRRVSLDAYEEKQKGQERSIEEIKDEAHRTNGIVRNVEANVHTLNGKLDALLAMLKDRE